MILVRHHEIFETEGSLNPKSGPSFGDLIQLWRLIGMQPGKDIISEEGQQDRSKTDDQEPGGADAAPAAHHPGMNIGGID